MLTVEAAQRWMESLNDVEHLAVAQWLKTGEVELLLTFESASNKLQNLRRLTLIDSLGK